MPFMLQQNTIKNIFAFASIISFHNDGTRNLIKIFVLLGETRQAKMLIADLSS